MANRVDLGVGLGDVAPDDVHDQLRQRGLMLGLPGVLPRGLLPGGSLGHDRTPGSVGKTRLPGGTHSLGQDALSPPVDLGYLGSVTLGRLSIHER